MIGVVTQCHRHRAMRIHRQTVEFLGGEERRLQEMVPMPPIF